MRPVTEYEANRAASASMRMAHARRSRLPIVKQLFERAGVPFPPRQLLLRVFKRDKLLEVWASDERTGPLQHVTTYGICYFSGTLGPKRKTGDLQVPEGFYTIGYVNSASAYHLSMQVSYPNRSDVLLGDPRSPGSDIMIHGDCVSIGCVSMGDERIEELWMIVTSMPGWQRGAQVHIFPARDMRELVASDRFAEHRAFWNNLLTGWERFEADRIVPPISVGPGGQYEFP